MPRLTEAARAARRPDGEIDDHVAERIRLRRAQVRMSQEGLAKALGVSFQQVQKYERGMNRVATSRLVRVAQALGCHPSFFLEGLPFPEVGLDEHDPLRSTELMGLLARVDRLDDRAKDLVSRLVDELGVRREPA